MAPSFTLEPFVAEDIESVDALLKAAYNVQHSRAESLKRLVILQRGGSFVARQAQETVGFGGALDYGPFAYIGLMATHPRVQRQGIARAILMEILGWLEKRNCPTVLLDASVAGAPLYEHSGFIDNDITFVMQFSGPNPQKHDNIEEVLKENELSELGSFDSRYFGADRTPLLKSYWEDDPRRFLISRDRATNEIDGFLIVQSRTIGPWVASNYSNSERLLRQSLTFRFEDAPFVYISASNTKALELLERYGFVVRRKLRHMYKGRYIERARKTAIFGQATLGFG